MNIWWLSKKVHTMAHVNVELASCKAYGSIDISRGGS